MDCPKRSALAGLPDDALVEILSRLPAKFLCRSKCVSRPWRDLIADRLRCKKLPQTLEGFFYGSLDTPSSSSSGGEDWSSDEDSDCSGRCRDESGLGFSGEDAYKSGSNDKNLPPEVQGRFVNLLGRPAPLVDPSFSFLRKIPNIGTITLLDSCGGLVLLGHVRDMFFCSYYTPGYIVCNPSTGHWVCVPSSGARRAAMAGFLSEGSDDDGGGTNVATYFLHV